MEKIELQAQARKERGKKINSLRQADLVPGIVYGSGSENISIAMDYNTLKKVYNSAGDSSLINLKIDDSAPFDVLVQDMQYDSVTDRILHVDFYRIDENKKLTTNVDLEFIGESRAVKSLGGTLFKALDQLEIECLPKNLISEIKVDISGLKSFEDKIFVKDIVPPQGVEILNEPDLVLAKVEAPRSEADLKKLDEKVVEDVSAIKPAVEKKEEAEEGKEAAAPEKEVKK